LTALGHRYYIAGFAERRGGRRARENAHMGLFGELQVRVDPWEVEYGAELPLEDVPEEAAADVALDVEVAPEAWQAIVPPPETAPARMVFVDGVRRIEARLIVRGAAGVCHGAFGSHAVGAVAVANGRASHESILADRIAVVSSGQSLPGPVAVSAALTYRALSTASPEADGPLRAIHNEMRLAEERLARAVADEQGTLVVVDGPLTFEDPVRGGAVGYIKRLFKLYLPEQCLDLLASLPAGARTPLFALRSTRRFARYAWFMRLACPHAAESDLSGIVRLEVSESVGVEAARRYANATASLLPRFAPGRSRDPRSPQNLLPIGALESRLRRHLGDPRLIRRHIESLIAREAA
jgi:hypothetical protein